MNRLKRSAIAALVLALSAPTVARAQLAFGVACSPGIPACASLRFSFTNTSASDINLNSLQLILSGAAWTFTQGPTPTIGTYSAEDAIGPFSGFTALSNGRKTASINFLENGFPFAIAMGQLSFVDLEASGPAPAPDASFTAVTEDNRTITGSTNPSNVVPEPASFVLMGAGLVVVGAVARRRVRRA